MTDHGYLQMRLGATTIIANWVRLDPFTILNYIENPNPITNLPQLAIFKVLKNNV